MRGRSQRRLVLDLGPQLLACQSTRIRRINRADTAMGIVKLRRSEQTEQMKTNLLSYRGYRFPHEIISHAVWLYHRFCLSFRDVEDLLAQRGITVSYETIRQWCRMVGIEYARTLRRRQGRLGDTWHLDELFVTIQGQRQYLWRAVDQAGDVIDILVQPRPRSAGSRTILSQATERSGKRTPATGHRQAEDL
jgi:transposase-like protein